MFQRQLIRQTAQQLKLSGQIPFLALLGFVVLSQLAATCRRLVVAFEPNSAEILTKIRQD